jgi:hypothetical protein
MSIPGYGALPPGGLQWQIGKSALCVRRVGELQTKFDALPADDPRRAEIGEVIAGLKNGTLRAEDFMRDE